MARNIRWQITFKSLNGTTCRVDIYDNDWPEGVTMGLRGAADPFYYEEDDSDDLLNDVLRYRTGYIRVIEDYYGQLDDIRPATTFDRYVEFLYGGVVMFNGYIQVQDFSHTLEFSTQQDPCSHVVEFPVISPMGLFGQRKFSRIAPPTTKTLGQLLDLVLNNGKYQKVVLPDITGVGLWMGISSLVVSPWNENYHHSMTEDALNKTMAPESYEYLIESICKAFGWICHDTPQALVFTMFDYEGYYCNYPVGHIGDANYKQAESIGTTAVALTDYYALADNNARVDTLLPDTGIEVKYEGHMGRVEFSFQRTKFSGVEMVSENDPREIVSICNLYPVDLLYENTASIYHAFDQSGFVTGPGAGTVAWNGKDGILVTGFAAAASGWELFRLRLYVRRFTEMSWTFDFGCMTSENGAIAALHDDEETKAAHLSVNIADYDDYVELTFRYVYQTEPLSEHFLIFIHDIKFTATTVDGEPYAEYRYPPAGSSDLLPSFVDNPPISSSVTMPISMYRLNDRMIGNSVRSEKITEYPYLLQKRQVLSGTFRPATAQAPDLFHARMWSYLSKKWRLIAQTFHPWDDEYQLTLQNSPIFDVVMYSITASAANTSLDGYTDSVYAGTSFNHLLTPGEGYEITSVVITMGNIDITSAVYDSATGQISISSVRGDVVITAVADTIYDAEVQYIEGTGTQYIQTDFIPTGRTYKFVGKFYLTGYGAAYGGWFGSYTGESYQAYRIIRANQNNSQVYFTNGSKASASGSASISGINNMYEFILESDKLNINGVTISGLNSNGTENTNKFKIFKVSTSAATKGKLYYFKIYNGNELVYDFIPVRKNGAGCLFDRVNGVLYQNAGSGTFAYGDDVNS